MNIDEPDDPDVISSMTTMNIITSQTAKEHVQ